MLTETDDLAAALDEAAREWPEDAGAPTRLLLRLIDAGRSTLAEKGDHDRRARRTAIRESAGALTGTYPADYLETLRSDWPE